MLKLGSNSIGKVFLGSTEINKAYLGSSLVFDGGGTPPTPTYDAQVEYLQTSGTQYIDTGVKGNLNTQIEVKYNSTTNAIYLCGCRGDNSHSITLYKTINANCRFGDKTIVCSPPTSGVIVQNKNSLYIDNSLIGSYNATNAFETPENIYLMRASVDTTASTFYKGKIYYFKMWNGETLVRDMIPVRVGTTGYMYDRVSNQLFGNAGSGSFTLGNDVII